MKYRLSTHAKEMIVYRDIKLEWVDAVITTPSLIVERSDKEKHYFGTIEAYENRCLKVVINPQKGLVITVYFDRQMRKKGCK